MIGISFHTGGFVDKPLTWVLEHLAKVGYDGVEIAVSYTHLTLPTN